MRSIIDLNDGWIFEGRTEVRLPHSAVELPFSYFDEKIYQRVFSYERSLTADPSWRGRGVSLVFEGTMVNTEVRLNGDVVGGHKDGYTPFEIRLNGKLREGENLLTVSVDGTENPAILRFGGRIDYLANAGIYREASIELVSMRGDQ